MRPHGGRFSRKSTWRLSLSNGRSRARTVVDARTLHARTVADALKKRWNRKDTFPLVILYRSVPHVEALSKPFGIIARSAIPTTTMRCTAIQYHLSMMYVRPLLAVLYLFLRVESEKVRKIFANRPGFFYIKSCSILFFNLGIEKSKTASKEQMSLFRRLGVK